jgi:hypothetical protein
MNIFSILYLWELQRKSDSLNVITQPATTKIKILS